MTFACDAEREWTSRALQSAMHIRYFRLGHELAWSLANRIIPCDDITNKTSLLTQGHLNHAQSTFNRQWPAKESIRMIAGQTTRQTATLNYLLQTQETPQDIHGLPSSRLEGMTRPFAVRQGMEERFVTRPVKWSVNDGSNHQALPLVRAAILGPEVACFKSHG